MKCKCHPQSAFNWRSPDYVPSINWHAHDKTAQLSQAMSAYVNKIRSEGKDVVVITGLNTPAALNPKKFAV